MSLYSWLKRAMIIYHNPSCSKSRQALQLCEESGSEIEVIEYLKTPLDEAVIMDLLRKLAMKPHEVVRTKEEVYSQLELSVSSTEEEIIAAIAISQFLNCELRRQSRNSPFKIFGQTIDHTRQ